jgi:hemerythrin-like metal-binding protein
MRSFTRSNRRIRKEWQDSFTVGIEELDVQHRTLLYLINETGDLADAQNTAKSATFTALNAMILYAENHFRTEEDYFERYTYPEHCQQKEEHEAFVDSVFSMAQELDKESALSLGSIILFLEDWYTDRVPGADQEYKQFLSIKIADEAKVVHI